MTTISPHGKGPLGPTGPQSRGEEIVGDIVVGSFVTVLAAGGTILVTGLLAFAFASAVQFAATETGLLAAWSALVQITQVPSLEAERIAGLLLDNMLFGAVVGLVLGIAHFVGRWRRNRHRWVLEAVISPSGLAAASYGVVCLFLHVAISVVAAWALGAVFGLFLPSPQALLAGHDAGLVFQTYLGAGGGGEGEWAGEIALRLLFFIVFTLLVAAALVCNLYAAAGWVFFRLAPWRDLSATAAEGAISGGASGIGALGAAMLLRCAITRLNLREDGWRKDAQRARIHLEDDGRSFAHAFVTAAVAGAAQAFVYAVIVFWTAAAYGIEVGQ
jgi:hypothetical protein